MLLFDRRSVLKTSLAMAGTSLIGAGLVRPGYAAGLPGPMMPAALVAVAKAEGQINAIMIPRDWANWGVTMDRFQEPSGVKLDDANPDGSSAEELQAIRSLKSQQRAPDVVDVGPAFAVRAPRKSCSRPTRWRPGTTFRTM